MPTFAIRMMKDYTGIILSKSHNNSDFEGMPELLQQKVQKIPGTVHYAINSYCFPAGRNIEDTSMMVYSYTEEESEIKYLDLIFCFLANRYCNRKDFSCQNCLKDHPEDCINEKETLEIATFRFTPQHLSKLVKGVKTSSFSESILNFSYNRSFSKTMPLCSKTKEVLEDLVNHSYTGDFENIYVNAQAQMVLLHSMECIAGESEEGISCKFSLNSSDKEKIVLARKLLLQHITEPLTIRELARMVATNECYLKKGFKELYGTTIFDFFQSQRMEHAKYLLYEKGLSVTEVSDILGYSSISHFSTAFRKYTGIKPCELFLRQG
jgi:AraC-like DNA-binding protein